MKTESVLLLVFLGLLSIGLARVMDDCCNFQYLNEHCIDMSVDYRDAVNQYNSDTCRFKRNMRIGQNRNPNANKFFVVYKSSTGLDCFYTRLYFIENASEESNFYRSNDGVNFVELNANQAIWGPKTPTGDNWYYYDLWFVNLPARTHFIRLQFKDWVNEGWINYWSPQISTVSFFEAGDPVCGDGVCGGSDHRNQIEDCHSCPQDCGACGTPNCGNGQCQYGETWAPRVGEHTTDLGYITCPEDCDSMYACGNERCDPGEVCGAQTQSSCAEDCCGMTRFDYYDGICGNGLCDGNETCSSCPGDCGACAQCGDGQCNGLETCSSCADDCGDCPTLYNAQCVYPVARSGQTPVPIQAPVPVPIPVAPVAPPVMPPYSVIANVIPGIVEAENYDAGGQDVAYHDTTPGNTGGALRTDDVDIQTCTDGVRCSMVGYIEAGEWLQYAVQVAQDGMYSIDARYAFPDGTPIGAERQVAVKIDGTQVAQLLLYPSGSYGTWVYCPAVQTSVPLTAGNHVLRLEFSQGYWNFNYVRFMLLPPAPPVAVAPVTEPVSVAPVTSAPTSPPVKIDAPSTVPVAAPRPNVVPVTTAQPSSAGTTPEKVPSSSRPNELVNCANELLSGVFTIVLVLVCFA